MANVFVADHPLVQHKLAILRNEETPSKDFRRLIQEITELMVYEATRDLPLAPVEVKTPVTTTTCHMLAGRKLAFVPI
ncbi:MAG: uracil phosphoribosyltransferase, partial [Clostridia bacterium]|nr:uracil phosphoribosyltransferase [Clostridia bacterium]